MKPWEKFFNDKITKIFTEKKSVVDIGGGLRIAKEKNNRFDKSRSWILPLASRVDYKIMDPVPDFNPDIVGDIHNLPFADNSIDAIICLAVLEHVEDPVKACKEMHRTLKPGGYALLYVPFLYYYHAEAGYYKDYWRFTRDSLGMILRDFSRIEMCPVRGALGTWIKLSPLGRFKLIENIFYYLDKLFGKINSKQVSGYNVFLIK
jgi:SAM-dependent methyltransferase